LFGEEAKRSEECSQQLAIMQNAGYAVQIWNGEHAQRLIKDIEQATVIIDALLGTGTKGELRPPYSYVAEMLAQRTGSVVAVDIPTGVNSDTGEAAGLAVQADVTIAFAYPKWGHFLYPGADYCGELVVADISIPPRAAQVHGLRDEVLTAKNLREKLPERHPFS
ncbi:NAD(P)H-hydrate epimerase, partial [Acinetobacter baumannii]|uniref:NAD(P)H-hydrate epimerase n=1 Tax=Acinetobacter baumannii TaxID=470 RepID=UPI0009A72D94